MQVMAEMDGFLTFDEQRGLIPCITSRVNL